MLQTLGKTVSFSVCMNIINSFLNLSLQHIFKADLHRNNNQGINNTLKFERARISEQQINAFLICYFVKKTFAHEYGKY